MYLPEPPFTQSAKVALMSATWVRCNVDSCEIPFDSYNQRENILPIQKSLSSHIGFYCFVIVTAKSEHFKQIIEGDTNSSLEPLKIQTITDISLGECNQERWQKQSDPTKGQWNPKYDRLWRQTGCKSPLFPLVPGRTVGCICVEGEGMEKEYHSPRSSLRESGRHCTPISPCPCDICQERLQKGEGNMLIIREFSKNVPNSYCDCFCGIKSCSL